MAAVFSTSARGAAMLAAMSYPLMTAAARAPWKTLRSRRGRLMLPHRFLGPLRAQLVELHELVQAVADALDDSRWQRAAEALERAAEALRDVAR